MCPAGSICSHEAVDTKAKTSSNSTGCVGNTSADNGIIPSPPPPFCSTYDNTDPTKATKCLNIETGLGVSLPTDPGGLINALIGIILSISGGIAIILIMISGYKMMLSQGNPDQIKDAREQLTAAIIGLLFVIFSLVILQIIGYNILKLPGFSQ
jgi:hypothetical protein